jgi:hypothetical protein
LKTISKMADDVLTISALLFEVPYSKEVHFLPQNGKNYRGGALHLFKQKQPHLELQVIVVSAKKNSAGRVTSALRS